MLIGNGGRFSSRTTLDTKVAGPESLWSTEQRCLIPQCFVTHRYLAIPRTFIVAFRWLGPEFTHSSNYIANIRLTSNISIQPFTKESTVSKSLGKFKLVSINSLFVRTTFLKDCCETSVRERKISL